MPSPIRSGYVQIKQHGTRLLLTSLSASELVFVSYVARRGVDHEEGSVQRLLNPTRISGIRDFALAGGAFPTSIILNWTAEKSPIVKPGGQLSLPRVREAAQIIDGQHRVMGLAAAIEKNAAIGALQIPVSIYENLNTTSCADIFLSINTEQKPVARSLVFDLYRVASDYIADPTTVRAGDVAKELNEQPGSPYEGYVKFPGSPPSQKGLSLSTIVASVKPLIEEKGAFEQVGLVELQMQSRFLINFFSVLRDGYGIEWEQKTNVFRTALGFAGAVEFLKNKLIVHCNILGDFTSEAIKKALPIGPGNLIRTESVEGFQGRRASTRVAEELEAIFDPDNKKNKSRRIKV